MSDFLKEVFGDKPLSFTEFQTAVSEKGLNIADLSSGSYVGKEKYSALEKTHKALKDTHDTLSKSIEGDEGFKTKLEQEMNSKKEIESKYNQTVTELQSLKNAQQVLSSGVSPDMAEFVAFNVGKTVTDTMDFDTALKNYLAQNPQFKSGEKVKVQTNLKLASDKTTASPNQAMNQAFLKATGRG